ncbi:MAG: PAS domain-containing protein [Bacteroidia bacterium]
MEVVDLCFLFKDKGIENIICEHVKQRDDVSLKSTAFNKADFSNLHNNSLLICNQASLQLLFDYPALQNHYIIYIDKIQDELEKEFINSSGNVFELYQDLFEGNSGSSKRLNEIIDLYLFKKSTKYAQSLTHLHDKSKILYYVTTDQHGSYSDYNKHFKDTFLIKFKDVVGTNSLAHIHPEDHQKTIDTVAKCFKNLGTGFRVDLRKPIQSNKIKYTSWEFTALLNEFNEPYIQCIGHDITPAKYNETQALQDKHQLEVLDSRVQSLLNGLQSHNIVSFTDHKGIIKDVNDNFCEISGYSRKELEGTDHSIVNSGYHPKSFFKKLWFEISQGRTWSGNIRNKRKDGTFYWVKTTITPRFKGADIDGYLSVRTDITALIAERQLDFNNIAQNELHNSSLPRLLFSANHELIDGNELGIKYYNEQKVEFHRLNPFPTKGNEPVLVTEINSNNHLIIEQYRKNLFLCTVLQGLFKKGLKELSDLRASQKLLIDSLDVLEFSINKNNSEVSANNLPYWMKGANENEHFNIFMVAEKVDKFDNFISHYKSFVNSNEHTSFYVDNGELSFSVSLWHKDDNTATGLIKNITKERNQFLISNESEDLLQHLEQAILSLSNPVSEQNLYDLICKDSDQLFSADALVYIYQKENDSTYKIVSDNSEHIVDVYFDTIKRTVEKNNNVLFYGNLLQETIQDKNYITTTENSSFSKQNINFQNNHYINYLTLDYVDEMLAEIVVITPFALNKEEKLKREVLRQILSLKASKNRRKDEISLERANYENAIILNSLGLWTYFFGENKLVVNEGWKIASGYFSNSPSALSLEDFLDCIHPEDRERVKFIFTKPIKNSVKEIELRYKTAKGTYEYVSDKLSLRNDKSGLILSGTRKNINAQRNRENDLKLLETVITNTNDAVLITDADLKAPGPRILYVNEAFERVSGYRSSELIGLNPRILQGAETDKTALTKIRTNLSKKKPVEVDLINYTKTGKPYWINVNIAPAINEQGEVTNYIAIERDITDQKAQEKELKEALLRFDLASRAAKVGVWDYDISNNNLLWDETMYELYGLHRENFTSDYEAWLRSLHPDDLEAGKEEVRICIETGKDFDISFRVITEKGEIRHIASQAHTVKDKNGRGVRMVGVNWDVTEAVKRQELVKATLAERDNLLNSVSEGYVLLDDDRKIIFSNEYARSILSMSDHDELIFDDVLSPDQKEDFLQSYNDTKNHKSPSQNVLKSTRHNAYFEIKTFEVDNSGNIAVLIKDITVIYEHTQELEKLKNNTNALINATSDAMWSIDTDFKLLTFNTAFAALMNKLTGEKLFTSKSVKTVYLNSNTYYDFVPDYEQAMKSGRFSKEIEIKLGKHTKSFILSLFPIYENNKKITGLACYLRDDTQTKRQMRKIQNQNKAFENISWLQSHSTRKPLANILGLIDLMSMESKKLDKDTQMRMSLLKNAAAELDKVVAKITKTAEVNDVDV